ncbi:protein CTLA-2-beta-like [Phodopus roborovskii]|uniref:protein CTLA-2-beta-like n=1 Tax=Phodopus roborovskii TaxID=109678 RepID=UPI0021E35CE4|nr:protein CTLA-2-beta-like [Phodopus roborovskii]
MTSTAPSRDPSLDAEWEEWKKKFGKSYSQDEEGRRRALWEEKKKKIEKHNVEYEQGKVSYSLGLNQFSDMTDEEFSKNCCGLLVHTDESPKSENLEKNS